MTGQEIEAILLADSLLLQNDKRRKAEVQHLPQRQLPQPKAQHQPGAQGADTSLRRPGYRLEPTCSPWLAFRPDLSHNGS
ncbi:TPA: hypothetical protein ACH3X1_000422 [Trebouxia sp. C0004]